MNKATIVTKLNGTFNRISFRIKKRSPEILITVGIGGVIVSTVMACRATTKLDPILKESRASIDHAKSCDRNPGDQGDEKKEVAMIYAQTGVKIVKLYAPSVVLGAASISSILASNNILRKRNVALAAAYTAVDKSFKEYRNRVVERFGEEVDKEIRYNVKKQKVEETVVDEETGKEKKVKKTVDVVNIDTENTYARYFDKETSKYWEKDHSYNMTFLSAQQSIMDVRLQTKHDEWIFLNDVYRELGIAPSKAGQMVGWNLNDPESDTFIDLRIQEVYREVLNERTGEMEVEKVVMIDPNCSGHTWDLMEK